jgi:hypothetical protein
LKASALTGISLLFFFSLADLLGIYKFLGTERLFQKKGLPIAHIVTSCLIVFGWYRYALYYNDDNNNNIFLLTVLPIWEMREEEIIVNLKILFNNLFPVFLNRPMFFLFFGIIIFVIANFRKLTAFLKYAFVFSGIYFLFYLLFFFQVFTVHDYYLTNLMIFPVITLFCMSHLLFVSGFVSNNISFVRTFAIVLLLFNSFHAAAIYRLRMIEDDKMVAWFPFISEDEGKLAKYLFWDYGNGIKRIEEFTPELRKHGIRRDDMVLSLPDQSFNISLYFLDQKGYGIARHHFTSDSTVMDRFLTKHLKYLIISDTTLKREKAFTRLASHFEPFFTKGNVQVLKFKQD